MLPSRGLRPVQYAPSAARQSTLVRCNASRKFSSLPRTAALAAPPYRTSPLQHAQWRTGATGKPHAVLTASSVRYASWYAPWSWGQSSTPGAPTDAVEAVRVAEFSQGPALRQHDAVTSATPEIAPAGIDKAAVVDSVQSTAAGSVPGASTASSDPRSIDDLLDLDPVKDVVALDPTHLVDHAGHLKELGLDYGWGMTATFEKLLETIYLSSGWGWAGSIIAAGLVVRCGTFAFQALASDKLAGMAALRPITDPINKKMEAALAAGDKQKADMYKMQQAQVMKPYIGGMASTAGFMILQGWVGFSAFRCLRAMGELPVPGLSVDGFLWFADLTVRDPYFILPATTSAIMYTVFKTGGEAGISNDATGLMRGKVMQLLALFIGVVTAFQPAILQLYFVTSGVLGGCTGALLRQNSFRRMIRIRPLPSKESNAVYSKVVSGELKLKDIKGRDGKIRYQAPNTPSKKQGNLAKSGNGGINIKAGTPVPVHFQSKPAVQINGEYPDRDIDFETPPTGLGPRLDWFRRNYRLAFMYRRTKEGMDSFMRKSGYGGPKMTAKQAKKKRDAEQYEIERRRRFENRK
ncbi:mitochondrial export translocase Oxa1 [Dothidotthia symphoricarpi CBS 119687]|uniref:Mitochondrial export translocase Oxa1 n=1 Tax=Dothidotthia symphoricarpi CBS 119687 TaxID=1392245 RepID=A0A6A6A2S0_9PLEO|nr:mitochondrial export translocase Oxa1 [Dothidotthia symphoricarpi CBS 119687]KAF2125464.1 mitochondrial export translocase Oxa1 [Dothidotthia symphoricarpi CBS 119687]